MSRAVDARHKCSNRVGLVQDAILGNQVFADGVEGIVAVFTVLAIERSVDAQASGLEAGALPAHFRGDLDLASGSGVLNAFDAASLHRTALVAVIEALVVVEVLGAGRKVGLPKARCVLERRKRVRNLNDPVVVGIEKTRTHALTAKALLPAGARHPYFHLKIKCGAIPLALTMALPIVCTIFDILFSVAFLSRECVAL